MKRLSPIINRRDHKRSGVAILPLVGSFDLNKSGVNSVYGLLHQGLDRHIVLWRSDNYPNHRTRKGLIGKGSMTMTLRKSQSAKEALKQGASVAEIVRQRLAS